MELPRPAGLRRQFADELVWRDATVPEPIRTRERQSLHAVLVHTFPDMHAHRLRRVVDADALAVERAFTATNTGPLALGGMSLPTHGPNLVGRATYFVTVRDGEIVEFHSYPERRA